MPLHCLSDALSQLAAPCFDAALNHEHTVDCARSAKHGIVCLQPGPTLGPQKHDRLRIMQRNTQHAPLTAQVRYALFSAWSGSTTGKTVTHAAKALLLLACCMSA
jgi:hypothetical protein